MSPEGIAAAKKKMVDYAVEELLKKGKDAMNATEFVLSEKHFNVLLHLNTDETAPGDPTANSLLLDELVSSSYIQFVGRNKYGKSGVYAMTPFGQEKFFEYLKANHRGVYRKDSNLTVEDKTNWDMDKINALPDFFIPNDGQVALLCLLVETGPITIEGLINAPQLLEDLIKHRYVSRIVYKGKEGFYAATDYAAGYYMGYVGGNSLEVALASPKPPRGHD